MLQVVLIKSTGLAANDNRFYSIAFEIFQTFNELTVEVGDIVEKGPSSIGSQPPPGMVVVKTNQNKIGLLPIRCLSRSASGFFV